MQNLTAANLIVIMSATTTLLLAVLTCAIISCFLVIQHELKNAGFDKDATLHTTKLAKPKGAPGRAIDEGSNKGSPVQRIQTQPEKKDKKKLSLEEQGIMVTKDTHLEIKAKEAPSKPFTSPDHPSKEDIEKAKEILKQAGLDVEKSAVKASPVAPAKPNPAPSDIVHLNDGKHLDAKMKHDLELGKATSGIHDAKPVVKSDHPAIVVAHNATTIKHTSRVESKKPAGEIIQPPKEVLPKTVEEDDGEAMPKAMDPKEASQRGVVAKKGSLTCNGEQVDSEIIYWKDVPGDIEFESPITPHHGIHHDRYISFEYDNGGWNNVRMSLECLIVVAHATGRTLVVPPQQHLYLLGQTHKDKHDKKAHDEMGFEDFFDIPTLKTHKGKGMMIECSDSAGCPCSLYTKLRYVYAL